MTGLIDKYSDRIVNNDKWHYTLFFAILLLLTAYSQIANTPMIYGDDTRAHYTRLYDLMLALQDGTFPWYIDYNGLSGYGYFMKAFYCDFLLIPFALIGLFTNAYVAYVAMMISTTLATGITTYWAVNRLYQNKQMATIAALLYTFCSYRLLDLYMRGAIGEVFTLIFLPIVLVGMYEITRGDYKKWYILSIGCTLIVFSHLLSTYITFIILAIGLLSQIKYIIKEPIRLKYLTIAALVTLCTTSYYLFPMLEQMQSNTFHYNSLSSITSVLNHHALSFKELLMGMVSVLPDAKFASIPQIGILLTVAILLRIFVVKKTPERKYADIMVIAGLILVFICCKRFPWHIFPFNLLTIILLPWRLFMISCLFFAVGGAFYAKSLLKTNTYYLLFLMVLAALCIIPIQAESRTRAYSNKSQEVIENATLKSAHNRGDFTYGGGNEYLPAKSMAYFSDLESHKREVIGTDSATVVSNYKLDKSLVTFSINKADQIEIPQTYYKGYVAFINDKQVSLRQSDRGLLSLDIPEVGDVKVYYQATTIQTLSTIFSCLSILAFCFYMFYFRKTKKK